MNFIDTLKSVDLVLSTNEVPLVVGESGIGKTGYTDEAGLCLASEAIVNGRK